jgi:hypothetical protein
VVISRLIATMKRNEGEVPNYKDQVMNYPRRSSSTAEERQRPIERLVAAAAVETTADEFQTGANRHRQNVLTEERRAFDEDEEKHEEQEEGPDYKAQVNPGPDRRRPGTDPRGDDFVGKEPTDGPDSKQQATSDTAVATMERDSDEDKNESFDRKPNVQKKRFNYVGHGADVEQGATPGAVAVYSGGQRLMEEISITEDTTVEETRMAERDEEMTDLPVAHLVTSIARPAAGDEERGHESLLLLCLGILAVIGAALGGVCGSGLCSPDESKSTATPATPPTTEEPPSSYKAFNSTDELYQAVDIYLLGLTEDPRESFVAQTYGYPIGTWNVSQIKNFSDVFAPDRGSQYDLLRPPTNFSNFNEDISGWNVSAAETMRSMFWACNHCTLRDCFNADIVHAFSLVSVSTYLQSTRTFRHGMSAMLKTCLACSLMHLLSTLISRHGTCPRLRA